MASSRPEQRLFSPGMPISLEIILPAALDLQLKERITGMPTLTTKDGVEIFYKDWGKGQPIVVSHGWPLSADDWDAQMLFFLKHGYRVIDTPRATASPASAIPDSSRWVRSWSTRPSSVNRKLWDRRSISLTPGSMLDRDRIIQYAAHRSDNMCIAKS